MTRFLHVGGLVCVLATIPALCFAIIPDADNSDTPDCIRICPAGDINMVTVVRDQNGEAMPDTPVRMIFSTAADADIFWCDGQAHPVIELTTGAGGEANFLIYAGGCHIWEGPDEPPVDDPGCVIIQADPGAVVLDTYEDVGSPDLHTDAGSPPNGDGDVDLLDFVVFAQVFDLNHHCGDLNDDGTAPLDGICDEDIDLLDFVVFAQHFDHLCP